MVIAGKTRGNAPQLASYLLNQGENERILIMDVDGRRDADASDLRDTLFAMELTSELTRSNKSVYHAYINPNPDDVTDRAMTMKEWQASVEILTKQLGYEDQRRVVVLHEKPGNRVHAHIVYERYNHERGTMATYQHNYKAHDRARAEMERKLNHKATPQKNKQRDQHRQTLTEIWQRTDTAKQFVKEAEANGYKIAKGTDRPYRVVDQAGVSFDLLRKLDGVKTREVRKRFGDMELMADKDAIREMQAKKQQPKQDQAPQSIKARMPQAEPTQPTSSAPAPAKTPDPASAREQARQQFLQNVKDVRERNRSLTREITMCIIVALRVCFSFKGIAGKKAEMPFVAATKPFTTGQFTVNAVNLVEWKHPPEPPTPINTVHFWRPRQAYKPTL